jgi:hypothetical protein
MSPVTYQTIKLSKGKHTSPQDGACVMELASMLAGEQFSDHPSSVCPVIGSFLRAYNDSVDDSRRQDLYAYASRVVGTRTTAEGQRLRAERLLHWSAEMRQRRWTRFLLPGPLRALGLNRHPPMDAVGTHAVHAIPRHTAQTHCEALSLIDELLELGTTPEPFVTPSVRSGSRPADVTVQLS